jgi:hypothetical protein
MEDNFGRDYGPPRIVMSEGEQKEELSEIL